MASSEPLPQPPIPSAALAAPVVALDADFDRRWAAWVARGRVHQQSAQRHFVIGAAVFLTGAVIVYAFIR